MKKKLSFIFYITGFILITFLFVKNIGFFVPDLNIQLLSQDCFSPGSKTSLRVIVSDRKTGTPEKNASVEIGLNSGNKKTYRLFSGRTDNCGTLDVLFTVPEDIPEGMGELLVKVKTAVGSDVLRENVKIGRDYRLMLTTDKPLYQPSQTIHIRTLLLDINNLTPGTSGEVTFEIEDPEGNKVFRKTLKTSSYGVAACDFTLADEVNMGNYKVKAAVGLSEAETTVTVKRYVLPKFNVKVNSDKNYYLPGETVTGILESDYFFGKPVAEGNVKLTFSTYDVEFHPFSEIKGKTDDKGKFEFKQELKDAYFAGLPLEKGKALMRAEAEVTDKTGHSEVVSKIFCVSKEAIEIDIIPESGMLVPGLENIVYVVTSYPDGTPAEADVTVEIDDKNIALFTTSPEGAGQFSFKAGENYSPLSYLHLSAKDDKGNRGAKMEKLSEMIPADSTGSILVRPAKALYRVGDDMSVDIFATAGSGSVFLDIIRNGQTRLTKSMILEKGKANFLQTVSSDMAGTLEIHAYYLAPDGQFIRDTAVVYVQDVTALQIGIKADKEVYRPGEEGLLTFSVLDDKGIPVPAALGITAVDESVFSLYEREPGLESVYLTLEKEILTPDIDICRRYVPVVAHELSQPENPLSEKAQLLGKILFSPCCLFLDIYPINRNTSGFKERFVRKWNQNFREVAGSMIMIFSILIVMAFLSVLVYHNRRGCKAPKDFFMDITAWVELPEEDIKESLPQINTEKLKSFLNKPLSWEELNNKLYASKLSKEEINLILTCVSFKGEKNREDGKTFLSRPEIAVIYNGYWCFTVILFVFPFLLYFLNRFRGDIFLSTTASVFSFFILIFPLFSLDKILYNPVLFPLKTFTWSVNLLEVYSILCWVFLSFTLLFDFSCSNNFLFYITGLLYILMFILTIASLYCYILFPAYERKWSLEVGCYRVIVLLVPILLVFCCSTSLYMPQYQLIGSIEGGSGGYLDFHWPDNDLGFTRGEENYTSEDTTTNFQKEVKPSDYEKTGIPPVYLRQYFPETLLFKPELITDEKGIATLPVKMADTITTWRLSATGNSTSGQIGSAQEGIRVFQDFFIDIDLPATLTQGDEIFIPVAVYNYLPEKQKIKLVMKKGDWFKFLKESDKTLSIDGEDTGVVYFPIKAEKIGNNKITVYAYGSKLNDAISRTVLVLPDGKEIRESYSGRVGEQTLQTLTIPENAIDRTGRIMVKIYPGMFSQMVEGLDSMRFLE